MAKPTPASDAERATEIAERLAEYEAREPYSADVLRDAAPSDLRWLLSDRAVLSARLEATEGDRHVAALQVVRLTEELAALRGGPEGPFENCHDCGRAMVWDNPDREMPTWMCPRCVRARIEALTQAVTAMLEVLAVSLTGGDWTDEARIAFHEKRREVYDRASTVLSPPPETPA